MTKKIINVDTGEWEEVCEDGVLIRTNPDISYGLCPPTPKSKVNIPFKWQGLDSLTQRAKVYGGWIVNTWNGDIEALVFIPDPEHLWEVDNDKT